jgi:hypothetical protein
MVTKKELNDRRGKLPNKRRKNEFAALTSDELSRMEEIVQDAFEGFGGTPAPNQLSEADSASE